MKRVVCCLSFLVIVGHLAGCSEDAKAPVLDETAPEVRILVPYDTEPLTFVVSDSIDVYVAAHDVGAGGGPGGFASIELFFRLPDAEEPIRIGEVGGPISVGSIADSATRAIVQQGLPPDWTLHTRRWYTGPKPLPPVGTPITSGIHVQLFATATDLAGNRSRTESLVPVAIFNEGEDLQCPDPVFTVTPTTAPQGTEFVFDPTYTSDQINEDVEIRVRWDFDGIVENGWTVDWDQDARASDVIRRVFDLQGVYTIRMEAHNSYLPDCIIEAPQRQIRVTPPGGEPDPPDPIENYMDVSVGIYPISKPDSTFVLDGARLGVDLAELPAHFADIRREFKISKYEVSNRWYLAYVDSQLAELEPPGPAIQFVAQAIWSRDTLGTEPPPPPVLYCQLAESRIFYSLDEERFVIEAGFEDHPVTGVTWDGANAYALTYGMRLPTEAEWEVAARGTNAELDYPFPGGIDLRADEGRVRVNYLDARRTGDPFVNGTTPVGFYNGQIYEGFQTVDTRSEFGCFDMAGNVAEWVNDWFGAYRSGTDIDPQGPPLGVFKVVRGGSHTGTRVDCRATARRGYAPGEYGTAVGFRCAFNPLEQPGK